MEQTIGTVLGVFAWAAIMDSARAAERSHWRRARASLAVAVAIVTGVVAYGVAR